MIPGCASDDPVKFDTPVVVDMAPVRCPEVDEKTKAEFSRTTPRPSGPVTKDGTRQWIDALELGQRRKNALGLQLVAELERCRGVAISPPATS